MVQRRHRGIGGELVGRSASMRRLLHLARDLVIPRGCAGCDKPDHVLCGECATLMGGCVSFPMPGTISGEGSACGVYRGPVRRAVLQWKDHGDEECDGPFARMLANTLADTHVLDLSVGRSVTLVPAPSTSRSMRERGRWHMRQLAMRTVAQLKRDGYGDITVVPLLSVRGASGKSVQTSGAAQRSQRLDGHITVADDAGSSGRRNPVVVVDDIVTSGATMRHCVDALRKAGYEVLTAVALAYTPLRDDDAEPVADGNCRSPLPR